MEQTQDLMMTGRRKIGFQSCYGHTQFYASFIIFTDHNHLT